MSKTTKIALAVAAVGALAPLAARVGDEDGAVDGFILVDMAMNGAIWFGLAMLVGWLVSKVRKSPAAPASPSAPLGGSPPVNLESQALTPGWYADPFQRFELRYWDGEWTSHVSSHGRTYSDSTE